MTFRPRRVARLARPLSVPAAAVVPAALAVLIAVTLVGCAGAPSPEELEAAKTTFGCDAAGERIVVRFATGEARLLLPDGERVTLYQVPVVGSGVRYTNGLMDLRGKGLDLELTRAGGRPVPLAGCALVAPPPR